MTPAEVWAAALAEWAIPDEILAQAPADPWVHPPRFFRVNPGVDHTDTPSHRAAWRALGVDGDRTVLDVGVGGGRSCLPLAQVAARLIGVDEQQAMLDQFASACADAGVASEGHLGRWPDVAATVPVADVAVCHHVAYNVAAIEPFLVALTAHARVAVVVELPDRHPVSWMNPLWARFWDLPRPSEPSAELFTDVVRSLGWLPDVAWAERPPRSATEGHSPEFVAFVRQRLCLPASRDAEVAAALADLGPAAGGTHRVATVTWVPR